MLPWQGGAAVLQWHSSWHQVLHLQNEKLLGQQLLEVAHKILLMLLLEEQNELRYLLLLQFRQPLLCCNWEGCFGDHVKSQW